MPGQSGDEADDSPHEAKALEAAAQPRWFPTRDLGSLTARMDISRDGEMAPYGDELAGSSEAKSGPEQTAGAGLRAVGTGGHTAGRRDEYWRLIPDF